MPAQAGIHVCGFLDSRVADRTEARAAVQGRPSPARETLIKPKRVMAAKAGIRILAEFLDSRFRGNDLFGGSLEEPCD